MGHHVGALAIDLLFARLMEVELNELVAFAVHADEAAGRVIDLDSVPVVDDLSGDGL